MKNIHDQKQNFFFKLWRIVYPLGIHYGMLFFVTLIGMIIISIGVGAEYAIDSTMNNSFLSEVLLENELNNALMKSVTVLTGLANLCACPLLFLFIYLDNKKYPLGKLSNKPHAATFVLAFLAGLLFCVIGNNLLISIRIEEFFGPQENLSYLYGGNLFVEILMIGILAPIGEELAFRGLMYRRMRDYMPAWLSIVLSSLIFGVYHGNLIQGIYAFILGLVLAYVYEKFQNIIAPILVHAAANTLSVVITETPIFNFMYKNYTTVLISLIVTAILGAATIVVIQLFIKPKRGERPAWPVRKRPEYYYPQPMPYPYMPPQPQVQPMPMQYGYMQPQPQVQPVPMQYNYMQPQPQAQPVPMQYNYMQPQPQAQPMPMQYNYMQPQPQVQPVPVQYNYMQPQPQPQPVPMQYNYMQPQPQPQPVPMQYNYMQPQPQAQPIVENTDSGITRE